MHPIESYPFKFKPFMHQLASLNASWDKEEFALLMDMGTGKSKVTIDTISMLWDAGKIDGALVIAPKGVYRNWSDLELPTHLPDHIRSNARIGYWTPSPNKKEKEQIEWLFYPNDDLNIFCMNVEALSTEKGVRFAERFLLGHKTIMVIDESTCVKNPGARRTKSCLSLGKKAKYRRILTGSPVTKSPLDLYSQCSFLDWHLLGFSSYFSFRNRYAVLKQQNFGGRTIHQVVGYRNLEELAEKIKPFSFRVTKDECLDLPEKIFVKRTVEMTDEQKKLYADMKRNAIASLSSGLITTTAVIVQLLRLHQIVCGFIKTDEGEELDLPSNRLSSLMEILDETSGKVIIWANYRRNIAMIEQAIAKEYGKESVVTYYGDTTGEDRELAKTKFQDPDSPVKYFVANAQTGGYGITLTQANTVIYYSNNYDLEKRLQSEDRAHRIGQKHNVTYIDMVTPDTVDEKILAALRDKNDIARMLTGDAWRSWI
jgi:SNF2 family DNA or RNA helicase